MPTTVRGKYFEDFAIGDTFTTMGRTITETDLVNFVTNAGFFEELFLNREYMKSETHFGSVIVPGALTYAYAEGLIGLTGMVQGTAVALLGTTIKVLGPLHVNDTIHVDVSVSDKRPVSNPSRGIVTFDMQVINQDGVAVLAYTAQRMIKRREG